MAPVPDDDVSALNLQVRTMIRLSDRFRAGLAAQLRIGVTELTALGHLVEEGEMSPTGLAARMGLAPATITAVVDHLAASGFARRTRNPTDRRRLSVSPTPAGVHARAWAEERLGQLVAAGLDNAAQPAPGPIVAFLERVNEALAADAQSASAVPPTR
jgi:DNA-binding MarR family transcriptional regulator